MSPPTHTNREGVYKGHRFPVSCEQVAIEHKVLG